MFGLGTWEIVLILGAALIFIGPDRLPKVAKQLGKGLKQVREAMGQVDEELSEAKRQVRRAVDLSLEDPTAPDEETAAAERAARERWDDARHSQESSGESPVDASGLDMSKIHSDPNGPNPFMERASAGVPGRVAAGRPQLRVAPAPSLVDAADDDDADDVDVDEATADA